MACKVDNLELCRHDEALRIRQMRNARALAMWSATMSIVGALLTTGGIILGWSEASKPWLQVSGTMAMCIGGAISYSAHRRTWIALREMGKDKESKLADAKP